MLRYAKGESDKSAGMAEMSEDMCNQSAEMLQELSGLNGDAHQMSHMSMEESFDLDSRLSLGVGKENKKSVKWLEDPQQSGENEATSFLRDRELEREECLRALADQERTIELAAQAAWEKELTTASGLGEAGPVDEEVGSSFDDEDEDANPDADECGGAAGRLEDTNVATQADARAGDDLGMTSGSNWSSDVETSSLELVKIAAPCSQHYNANDHPLISAKQNVEPLSPDEEAAVTADSSEHTGFGAMDGSSPILAVAVAKGTCEDHPTHKEPRVGALEQPSHELGSDAGAFLRPAHSPAPSPGLTSTAAEWIRRASSGNTSEEEEDARGKTATTRRLDRAEPLSAIVKGDPASPHYLGRENAGGEDKSGVQAYLQVCFDMRTTPISKVCRPGGESLTRLDLAHRGIGNRGATALAALLRVNATLTDVVLDDNNLSSDGAAALFAAMAQANVVKTLRMAANSKMAPAIQRAASSPDGTAADSAGDAAGRAASGSGSNTLGSWEGGAVPGGAGGLASWLARENASLETLDLSKCRLGDSGIKAIASALEANGNDALAALHLGDNDVSDEGAGVLFSVLARCGNLGVRHLDLRWNRLKDASHISDALQRSTTLSALQLQWNKLGDTGARQIGAGIEGGAVLRQLDLSFNDVTGAGCDALARGLVASKHMTDVLLSGNPAIGLTGVVSLLSGIDPEGPVTRILVQGCGLSARDGAMAEIVAPEIGAASDAAKVTLASDVGRDNVQALKLLCPELLGSLRIGRRAASAGPKRISSAKSTKGGLGQTQKSAGAIK